MKLKDYISHLRNIAKNHPDLEVVYSADDEGNKYSTVYYSPTVGKFDGETFSTEAIGNKKPNAVCVN
jgi:hypothetical protein